MTSGSRTSAPKIGELFAGKFRIERELGRGGMGAVYLAMHEHLEERVALKLLHPEAAVDGEAVKRFLREGKAAIKIKSPHVAQILDNGMTEDGIPYMTMEYLEGRDLGALLEARGPLPLVEAVDYLAQACVGLAAAHAKGIVHRDLKPANLFLANVDHGDPTVKILDFGISKLARNGNESVTGTSVVMGSPFYMSPEQLRSTRDVDARADIWSLGVILFELVTDRLPFERESIAEVTSAILRDLPSPLRGHRSDLPAPVEDIVNRCLEKDASRRFASAAELIQALIPYGTTTTREAADSASRLSNLGAPRNAILTVPVLPGEPSASGDGETVLFPVAGASTKSTWAGDTTDSLTGKHPKARALVFGSLGVALLAITGGVAIAELHSAPRVAAEPTHDPSGNAMGNASAAPLSVPVSVPAPTPQDTAAAPFQAAPPGGGAIDLSPTAAATASGGKRSPPSPVKAPAGHVPTGRPADPVKSPAVDPAPTPASAPSNTVCKGRHC